MGDIEADIGSADIGNDCARELVAFSIYALHTAK